MGSTRTPGPHPCGCCCMGSNGGWPRKWTVVSGPGTGCFAALNDGILVPFEYVQPSAKECVYRCLGTPGLPNVFYRRFINGSGAYRMQVSVQASLSPGFRIARWETNVFSAFACGVTSIGQTPTYFGGTSADGEILGVLSVQPFRRVADALGVFPDLSQHCLPTLE